LNFFNIDGTCAIYDDRLGRPGGKYWLIFPYTSNTSGSKLADAVAKGIRSSFLYGEGNTSITHLAVMVSEVLAVSKPVKNAPEPLKLYNYVEL
jgi:hypothetical protein